MNTLKKYIKFKEMFNNFKYTESNDAGLLRMKLSLSVDLNDVSASNQWLSFKKLTADE